MNRGSASGTRRVWRAAAAMVASLLLAVTPLLRTHASSVPAHALWHGMEQPVPACALPTSGQIPYYLQDQLGSTRGLLDSSGNIAGTYTFSDYGHQTDAGSGFRPGLP